MRDILTHVPHKEKTSSQNSSNKSGQPRSIRRQDSRAEKLAETFQKHSHKAIGGLDDFSPSIAFRPSMLVKRIAGQNRLMQPSEL